MYIYQTVRRNGLRRGTRWPCPFCQVVILTCIVTMALYPWLWRLIPVILCFHLCSQTYKICFCEFLRLLFLPLRRHHFLSHSFVFHNHSFYVSKLYEVYSMVSNSDVGMTEIMWIHCLPYPKLAVFSDLHNGSHFQLTVFKYLSPFFCSPMGSRRHFPLRKYTDPSIPKTINSKGRQQGFTWHTAPKFWRCKE